MVADHALENGQVLWRHDIRSELLDLGRVVRGHRRAQMVVGENAAESVCEQIRTARRHKEAVFAFLETVDCAPEPSGHDRQSSVTASRRRSGSLLCKRAGLGHRPPSSSPRGPAPKGSPAVPHCPRCRVRGPCGPRGLHWGRRPQREPAPQCRVDVRYCLHEVEDAFLRRESPDEKERRDTCAVTCMRRRTTSAGLVGRWGAVPSNSGMKALATSSKRPAG